MPEAAWPRAGTQPKGGVATFSRQNQQQHRHLREEAHANQSFQPFRPVGAPNTISPTFINSPTGERP